MDSEEIRDTATAREKLATEFDHAVEVDGRIMNVNIQGDGADVVVLLPGRGVTAPSCDFAPLIAQLTDSCKVVTLEPFGSGLSDMTDKPRTSERVVGEYHEALEKLGMTKYTLVAHSISGLHGLHYANIYPDEVQYFVGIDTATPGMDQYVTPELIEATSTPDDMPYSVEDDMSDVVGYQYSPVEINKMRILHQLNEKNDAVFEQLNGQQANETADRGDELYGTMKFPQSMTVQFFLSSESTNLAPEWYEREHDKQLTEAEGSKVVVLEGGHFLHHSQAVAIAEAVKAQIARE